MDAKEYVKIGAAIIAIGAIVLFPTLGVEYSPELVGLFGAVTSWLFGLSTNLNRSKDESEL